MTKLTFLGTGNALVTRCYNACFTISEGGRRLLVDAGGGNQILTQLAKKRIDIGEVKHVFISHAHSDHILGCVWLMRFMAASIKSGRSSGGLHVYASKIVLESLKTICKLVLPPYHMDVVDKVTVFNEVRDGELIMIYDWEVTFFDLCSTAEEQYGLMTRFPDGKKLTFFGDEPYRDRLSTYGMDADYMIHEVFCLYSDRDAYRPYEKNHGTVREACENAIRLNAKKLILLHMNDSDLRNRKRLYTAEARQFFGGEVFAPDDLDEIVV